MDSKRQHRISVQTRAVNIFQWITEQVQATDGKIHPERITDYIAAQIGEAEQLAHIPKFSQIPFHLRHTTKTKAVQAVAEMFNELRYLGRDEDGGISTIDALRVLERNLFRAALIEKINALLVQQFDAVISVLEPLLQAGCPSDGEQTSGPFCYYCEQLLVKVDLVNHICKNMACPWGGLYRKVRG